MVEPPIAGRRWEGAGCSPSLRTVAPAADSPTPPTALADGLGRVHDELLRAVAADDAFLTEIAAHLIKAGGGAFPWNGDGAPEHVEVMFRLGQEWHCASATGATSGRGFRAKNQFAPAGCAPLVCGDGVRQLGEACDDGNVEDADSCTNTCVRGVCNQQSFGSTWARCSGLAFRATLFAHSMAWAR